MPEAAQTALAARLLAELRRVAAERDALREHEARLQVRLKEQRERLQTAWRQAHSARGIIVGLLADARGCVCPEVAAHRADARVWLETPLSDWTRH